MIRGSDLPRLQSSFDLFCGQQSSITKLVELALDRFANDFRSAADQIEASGAADCKSPVDLMKTARKQLALILKSGTTEVGNMLQKMEAVFHSIEGLKDETPLDYELLDRIIINHFLRSGRFSIAQCLIHETRMNVSVDDRFVLLDAILTSLRQKDITSCVNWCRNQGNRRDYHFLLFHLHRIEYLQLLEQGHVNNAVNYARANFVILFPEYAAQIGDLMGMLMFVYSKLRYVGTSSHDWIALEKLFISIFCKCMGLSKESPLSVCVAASQIALPPLVKINALQSKTSALTVSCNASEIALDLGKRFQYHSTFVCPVSKSIDEQPMRSNTSSTIKCPYCSVEQSIQDSLALQF